MSHTILHHSHLMSTPLILLGPILQKEHKCITASYAMGVNYVSPNDVAHAVVKTLVNFKKHKNKTYSLTEVVLSLTRRLPRIFPNISTMPLSTFQLAIMNMKMN